MPPSIDIFLYICFWAHVQELNIIFQPRVFLLRCKFDHVISLPNTLRRLSWEFRQCPKSLTWFMWLYVLLPSQPLQLRLTLFPSLTGLGPSWSFSFIGCAFPYLRHLCLEDLLFLQFLDNPSWLPICNVQLGPSLFILMSATVFLLG